MSLLIEITETSPVVTEPVVTVIEVAGAGPQGAKGDTGDQGPVGPGVPAGGVEFDLIEKASGDDFDTRYTSVPTVRGIQLSTTNPADVETGRIVWNDGDEVPQFRSNGITVDLSLEMLARCRNVTGSMIQKGTAVCIVGASAQRISIAPSNRTEPGSACRTLGLTLEPIANNNFGKVSTFGLVRGLNTAGIDGDEGDELFVGETPGSLTTTPPDAPARRLTVGYLVTKSVNQGRIFVSIRRGVRVEEIDDVQVDSVADGDVIRFDDIAERWENKPLGTAADADAGDFDAAGSADAVQGNLTAHIADDTNPHQVTAEQVGLGNVDNTADLDKPISNDTQAALDDKAEKATQVIAGIGLDGGGDLSEDRTLNLDSATVASLGKADSALQSGDNVSELTNDAGYIDAAGAPVQSVNGETGEVSLDAGDVGLGNVPNLDTNDAVAKAHDQNTDTALAEGTVDEVSAATLKQASTYSLGPVAAYFNTDEIPIWDNFRRTGSSLGTAESGQPWIDVVGTGFATNGRSAQRATNTCMSWIERPAADRAGVQIFGHYSNRIVFADRGFVFARDENNYLFANFGSGNAISIVAVVAGVATTVATSDVFTGARAYQRNSTLLGEFTVITTGTRPIAVFRIPSLGQDAVAVFEDVSGIITTDIFPTTADMRFAGIRATGSGRFYSFGVRNIGLP